MFFFFNIKILFLLDFKKFITKKLFNEINIQNIQKNLFYFNKNGYAVDEIKNNQLPYKIAKHWNKIGLEGY